MLIQKKKIKNRREETKIDSEIEKKKRWKMTFGVWSFFLGGGPATSFGFFDRGLSSVHRDTRPQCLYLVFGPRQIDSIIEDNFELTLHKGKAS